MNRNNVEIRNQLHLMDAEGLQDDKPSENEIIELLSKEGYTALNIDIWFDSVMDLWGWNCDIRINFSK